MFVFFILMYDNYMNDNKPAIIKKEIIKKEPQKRVRNPFLMRLSDEELDVLEILAKKSLSKK